MSRYKFKQIWIALYGINLYWVCCDRDNYEKLVKDEFGEDEPKLKDGRFEVYVKKGQDIDVIWLRKNKAKVSELTHEAFHATHWIMQGIAKFKLMPNRHLGDVIWIDSRNNLITLTPVEMEDRFTNVNDLSIIT